VLWEKIDFYGPGHQNGYGQEKRNQSKNNNGFSVEKGPAKHGLIELVQSTKKTVSYKYDSGKSFHFMVFFADPHEFGCDNRECKMIDNNRSDEGKDNYPGEEGHEFPHNPYDKYHREKRTDGCQVGGNNSRTHLINPIFGGFDRIEALLKIEIDILSDNHGPVHYQTNDQDQ